MNKMTEIKKLTKIALIVDAIIFFIFGVNLTFLYDMTMNPEGFTNPYFPRFWGGTLLPKFPFCNFNASQKGMGRN